MSRTKKILGLMLALSLPIIIVGCTKKAAPENYDQNVNNEQAGQLTPSDEANQDINATPTEEGTTLAPGTTKLKSGADVDDLLNSLDKPQAAGQVNDVNDNDINQF